MTPRPVAGAQPAKTLTSSGRCPGWFSRSAVLARDSRNPCSIARSKPSADTWAVPMETTNKSLSPRALRSLWGAMTSAGKAAQPLERAQHASGTEGGRSYRLLQHIAGVPRPAFQGHNGARPKEHRGLRSRALRGGTDGTRQDAQLQVHLSRGLHAHGRRVGLLVWGQRQARGRV